MTRINVHDIPTPKVLSRLFVLITILISCLVALPVAPCAASASQDEAPWQGTASGSFSVNGKPVKLTYAYAMEEPDSFDEKATVISVLLTAAPLPRDAFTTESLFFAMDKTSPAILYTVDKTGETKREVIIHPGIESGGAQFSGVTTGKMTLRTKTAKQIDGSITVQQTTSSFLDFTYAAQVTFSAPLLQAKRKAPSLDASTGKRLPDDGGKPAKALMTFITALQKKDLKTVRSMAPAEIRKKNDEELGQIVEMIGGMYPKNLRIVRGFATGSQATLYVTGMGDDGTEYGIIDMLDNGETWIVDNQKWSNRSFDENRNGK